MLLPTPGFPLTAAPTTSASNPDEGSADEGGLIPSSGLSLDSEFGFVDLVAVDRVRWGHPTPLTRADLIHLLRHMPRNKAAAVLVAEALLPA